MKKCEVVDEVDLPKGQPHSGFPGQSSLAALRAWYAGLNARVAVVQYLGHENADGQSSRAILGTIRRQLASFARTRHREDLAVLLEYPAAERLQHARAVLQAVETLRLLPAPTPLVTDCVAQWLPARAARALEAHGIKTLADLTVRVPRRRRWWAAIPGLGVTSAKQIEAFFAVYPTLTERARALVSVPAQHDVVPWERLYVPQEVDGSQGTFRAPAATCTLSARNDYEAVQAWLGLHESAATQRAYRKEAERLILWAVLECGRALTSLTTEDAVAYRAFLRHPTPTRRWAGPARHERPATGNLSPAAWHRARWRMPCRWWMRCFAG